ncbi:MAG: hypothetical protein COB58_03085 [Thalassobium sp.]|nr:MAG: hypothetical protein COB43_01040 [Oceanospirillales bacterium]PHQ87754.1 MAG: hypothetical protein COB58_03085 [Thalassobium sp.]
MNVKNSAVIGTVNIRSDSLTIYLMLGLFFLLLVKSFFYNLGVGSFEVFFLGMYCVLAVANLRDVKFLNMLYGLFLLSLLISTFLYYSDYEVGIFSLFFQFFVYIKLLLVVYVVLVAFKFEFIKFSLLIYKITKITILFSVFLIPLQYFLPDLVVKIFQGQYLNTYIAGLGIRRMTGIYNHPTLLGYISALSFIYIASLVDVPLREKIIYMFFSLLLLIVSGQRGEIGLLILCFPLGFVFKMIAIKFSPLRMCLFFCMAYVFLYWILLPYISNDDFTQETVVRYALYAGAFDISSNLFPFGSGMATYGSSNSVDSLLYYDTGIESLWWFSKGASFLTDTAWAMTLAESGFLGTLFYVGFLGYFIGMMFLNNYSYYSYCLAVFILIESLSNPTFTSYSYVMLLGFFYILFSGGKKVENSSYYKW